MSDATSKLFSQSQSQSSADRLELRVLAGVQSSLPCLGLMQIGSASRHTGAEAPESHSLDQRGKAARNSRSLEQPGNL